VSRKVDVDERIWKLYDGYVHGTVSRREFLEHAAYFTASGVSAATLLSVLSPDYALAQQVDPGDASISASYKKYASPKGAGVMRGYFARPSESGHKLPGVVVIHENRGLNPYIEDVARRLAVAGFIAFAPDALTPLMLNHAGLDERVNASWPAFEKGLKAAGVIYVHHDYEGVQHGFHNDTTPRYDKKAAELAWTRTVQFLDKHLKSDG
jgi:acetyl esterase/lipase